MRVTNQSVSTLVMDRLQQAFRRMAHAQEAVSSGKRINRLSDDPIGAVRVLDLRSVEASLGQYERNLKTTLQFLEQNDAMLDHVVQNLTRAKELTLAMANDTNSLTERMQAAKEVRQIFLQVLSLANTKVENRFLFGGFKNGVAPFSETPGGVAYGGDSGEIFMQANAAQNIAANLAGNKVFQGAGLSGGVGLFDVLLDLESLLQGRTNPNTLSLAVNLDATTVAGAGFSVPDAVGSEALPATFLGEADFSTVVTVFDSLGEAHHLTFLFAKTGGDTFKYRVVANSNEITGGTAGNYYQVGLEGTLEFNPDGSLNAGASVLTDLSLTGLVNGASDITILASDLNFTGSTHLADASSVLTLAQSNTSGFNAQLGRLDAAIDQILAFRAELGARLNSAQTAMDALEVMKIKTTGQRSHLEDADVLAVYSDFARFQQAFEAALQSASLVIRPSLLDFLR